MAVRKDATGSKTIYPHVIMHSAALLALELAETNKEGSYHQSIHSCLSTAFCLEAYFNYLGEQLLDDWKTKHEKKPPKEKVKILSNHVGYKLDHSSTEYDSFTRVFAFRNALVHGKVETVTGSWPTKQKGKISVLALEAEWEKLANPKTARKIYEDCSQLVSNLHSASGVCEPLFASSMAGDSVTLL